jgi:hypothetical protein
MKNIFTGNTVLAFVLGWLAAFTCASLAHSLMVVLGLLNIGVALTWSQVMLHIQSDWLGLIPTYGIIILIGLIGALLFAHFIHHRWLSAMSYTLLCISAGGCVMLVILMAMQPILGVTLIAGARTAIGLLLQINAGVIGGLVFALIKHTDSISDTTGQPQTP